MRYRGVILTDSNGRGATSDTVKAHIDRGDRDKYDIELVTVYTVEEALHRVASGNLDVKDAYVVIDTLTNEVRGTRQRPAVSPEVLVQRVDRLRKRLIAAGAKATVVCQIKPMETADVTHYNALLFDYLQAEHAEKGTGFGCWTQIRRSFLKLDGYHVGPRYASVIDRTYACALVGVHVPCPTPWDDFAPEYARRRRDIEYPSLVSGNGGARGGFLRAQR